MDLDFIAGQEEFNLTSAAYNYRQFAMHKPMARRFTIESIDEAIRDLQEARVYVENAKALEKAA